MSAEPQEERQPYDGSPPEWIHKSLAERKRRAGGGIRREPAHYLLDESYMQEGKNPSRSDRIKNSLAWGGVAAFGVDIAIYLTDMFLSSNARNQPSLLEHFISPQNMASSNFFLASLAVEAVVVGGLTAAAHYGITTLRNRRKK